MRVLVLLVFLLSSIESEFEDEKVCGNCTGSIKTYTNAPGDVNPGNNAGQNDPLWSLNGVPGANDIARFNQNGDYIWSARNSKTIKGVILEGDAKLTLDIDNQTANASFSIEGTIENRGCIVVRKGSKLTLQYVSRLKNVDVCVEEGGEIIFNSRSNNRNDYFFDGVNINLQGPDAKLTFDLAEINIQPGGLVVSGWSGDGYCSDPNNDNTAPDSGESGNISWTRNTFNICSLLNVGILPVEWHNTSAQINKSERTVTINWSTAKEWENSHFEIERSINGVSNWEKVGQVPGVGWSDEITEYCYLDEELPLRGGRVYYRIKQVDFDKSFDYSETLMVQVPGMQVTKGEWRAYPNPVGSGPLQVSRVASAEVREDVRVRVFNTNIPIASFSAKSESELNEKISGVFNGTGTGVFILELHWDNKVEYHKILKQ